MHNYKRTGGLTYIFLLSASILFNLNLYAANNPDDTKKLDSVYNAYLNLRGKHPQSLIPGVMSINDNDRKCSFGLVSYLYTHRNELSLSRQKVFSELKQRQDLEKSIVSPSGKFRIHYNSTGSDAPSYDPHLSAADNVYQVALAFDSASSYENNYLGYLFPPGDHGLGGDDLYDVYIINESQGEYGTTWPDDQVFDKPTSYIEIDNDFSKDENYNTTGFNGMRVTAAHEFHHAIQVGSYGGFPQGNDTYFYELTSTSMEEFVYNTVNDYYFYLRDYFSSPSKSLPQYDGYGLAIWNIYLVKKYGFDGQMMIRRQWELKATGVQILSAINTTLLEHASTFRQALNEYGTWMYFTGYRKAKDVKNKYFDEGANYPTIKLYDISYSPPGQTIDFFVKPLSNTYKKFANKSQAIYPDSIVVITTNADVDKAENNPDEDIDAQDVLSASSFGGSNRLSDSYFWKVSSSDNSNTVGTAILNNNPPDSVIPPPQANNEEEPYPVPFSYQNNVYISIPAFYNDTRYAELKIFSISMDMVFNKNENITKDINNNFVVSWNGMDSKNRKLPTGVYIYVTSSDDKIKTGKLVIKNE